MNIRLPRIATTTEAIDMDIATYVVHYRLKCIEQQNIEQGMSNVEVTDADRTLLRDSAVLWFDILLFGCGGTPGAARITSYVLSTYGV